MLTKELIRATAIATIGEHGAHLALALRRSDSDVQYGAGNLAALMELFAEKLLAAASPDIVSIIDGRMGSGWTRELAENLSNTPRVPVVGNPAID